MKNEFSRYGFRVVEDSYALHMDRPYSPGIVEHELDFEPIEERRTLRKYISLIESERRG